MNLVVTGGCGFIGRNLVELALSRGARVRVVDDLSAGTREDVASPLVRLDPAAGGYVWSDDVQLLRADVKDLGAMRKACRGADRVVHLAASTGIADSLADPPAHIGNNVVGTVAVLEASRLEGVGRCVLASSGAAVGDANPPMHERLLPSPVSPYGASKLAAEASCLAYRAAFGVDGAALRFSNVYGPHSGHKTSAVAWFIGQILDDKSLTVYGDGEQTRDFVFARDLVEAVWLTLAADRLAHGVYQIGSGVETSVNQLVAALDSLAQRKIGRRPQIVYREARAGEVRRNYADISRARDELGFIPKTPLATGLETTFDWLLAQRRRPS